MKKFQNKDTIISLSNETHVIHYQKSHRSDADKQFIYEGIRPMDIKSESQYQKVAQFEEAIASDDENSMRNIGETYLKRNDQS